MRSLLRVCIVAAALSAPSTAFAQAVLTGVVTDGTGAVLPGVTVEARSPALIERVRTTTTDASGRYRIIDLPSGTYELTLTLASFSTVKRPGIELEGTFTASINLQMNVGGIEQSVTIEGRSPIVNIESAKQEDVVRREDIVALPIARDFFSIATLVPGMVLGTSQDIGGLVSTKSIVNPFTAHGGVAAAGHGNEGRLQVDGLSTGASALFGTGTGAYMPDISNAQEVSVLLSGGLGSTETGGPVINVIPRSGGNNWAAQSYYNYSNSSMQDRNISSELKQQNPGLNAPVSLIKAQDFNVSGGGPIAVNHAWFWTTARWNMLDQRNGMYYNLNAGDATKWTYEPGDPSFDDTRFRQFTARLTWQASQKNKLTGSWDRSYKEVFYKGGGGVNAGGCATTYCSPEAGITSDARPQNLPQVTFQRPQSTRMLVDAGFSWYNAHTGGQARPGTPRELIGVSESATNIPAFGPAVSVRYRSMVQIGDNFYSAPRWRAAVSYNRWSQNLRLGYDGIYFKESFNNWTNDQSINYNFTGGQPVSFNVRAVNGFSTPARNWTQNTGIYLEDSYTLNRVTLQGAVRFDYATSGNPEIVYGPGKYFVLTPVVLPEAKSVTGYKDLTPRMSLAWDAFGNGKTSVKFNLGKYLAEASNGGNYNLNNPATQLSNNAYTGTGNRAWTDNDHDYEIDCDITNPAAQSPTATGSLQTVDSCGLVTLAALGTPTATTSVVDPAVLHGWGVRPNDTQMGIAIQQEVLPRFSVEVGYRRRWFGNFTFVNNYGSSTMGADCGVGKRDCVNFDIYQPYSITAPLDPRLPDGGGYQVTGLYDPTVAVSSNTYTTREDDAHRRTVRWQGVDVNLTARMANGLILRGGFVMASTLTDTCKTIVDNPESLRTCHSVTPWAPNAKFSAIYTTPTMFGQEWTKGFTSSIIVNARPQNAKSALYPLPNADVQAALGRPPTGSTTTNGIANGTVTKDILIGDELNNSQFLDTQWNADLRVSRIVRVAKKRIDVGVDVFNFLNIAAITGRDTNFNITGPNTNNWLRPTAVQSARFAKFYVQFDF